MRFSPLLLIYIVAAVLLGLSLLPENPLYAMNWPLFSVLILGLGIITFFKRFESRRSTSKEIAIIASLASLAAIVRVPFAVIMSLQPTTFVVMIHSKALQLSLCGLPFAIGIVGSTDSALVVLFCQFSSILFHCQPILSH